MCKVHSEDAEKTTCAKFLWKTLNLYIEISAIYQDPYVIDVNITLYMYVQQQYTPFIAMLQRCVIVIVFYLFLRDSYNHIRPKPRCTFFFILPLYI